MEITYSKYGDYYLPDLAVFGEKPTYGCFDRMRLKYLKEHRRATYINLKTSDQLTRHLTQICVATGDVDFICAGEIVQHRRRSSTSIFSCSASHPE